MILFPLLVVGPGEERSIQEEIFLAQSLSEGKLLITCIVSNIPNRKMAIAQNC